jgi:hypothetical protein
MHIEIDSTIDKNLWLSWIRQELNYGDVNTTEYILRHCNFAGYMFGPLIELNGETLSAKTYKTTNIFNTINELRKVQDKIYFYRVEFNPSFPLYYKSTVDYETLPQLEMSEAFWLIRYVLLK